MTTANEYTTLDDWIADEALPCSLDARPAFDAAIDQVIDSLDPSTALLGFGEALHGGEELLMLRNQLFRRLVEAHGYSAITIESSFPRGTLVNDYVLGRSAASYDDVWDAGFSHGFGALEANRELIEWIRIYNADRAHPTKLHFYGFDSPTDMTTDSPRRLLDVPLRFLNAVDAALAQEYQRSIEPLLGSDATWENPAAAMDPTQAYGLSPAATALRIATEDLISELRVRRPDLIARSDSSRYEEALHHAVMARQLLNYHAELARSSAQRQARLLGIRDAMMADNLAYIVNLEQERGKVLVFAHNNHLKRGKVEWRWQDEILAWWPVGAHLDAMYGRRYVVIGSGVGTSPANGIGQPEPGTLEARFSSLAESIHFIPTHHGQGLPAEKITALPVRSGSTKNGSYMEPLGAHSFTDFDWLTVVNTAIYSRGGPSLEGWGERSES